MVFAFCLSISFQVRLTWSIFRSVSTTVSKKYVRLHEVYVLLSLTNSREQILLSKVDANSLQNVCDHGDER